MRLHITHERNQYTLLIEEVNASIFDLRGDLKNKRLKSIVDLNSNHISPWANLFVFLSHIPRGNALILYAL